MQTKMARNGNENEFQTSKMAAAAILRIFFLKIAFGSEKVRNANKNAFRTSKMASGHFEKKMKIAFRSKMVRNAKENEFRTSKMAAGGHFEKNIKTLFLSEMAIYETKINFGYLKWLSAAI